MSMKMDENETVLDLNVDLKENVQDPSLWEYEAPHYFDFSQLNSSEIDAKNDEYFSKYPYTLNTE